MKAVDVLVFGLFLLCAIPFFIAFVYLQRANFYLLGRVLSGEIGWNPFLWGRALRHDSYFVEMMRRARRWMLIYVAEVALLMLLVAIVMGVLALFGVVKVAPTAKPAAPTKPTPTNAPRVLAPVSRENRNRNAVLK